jgi:hypothetical protein
VWDFVNHKRRLVRTLATAQEECEKHQRFWMNACEAGGVRALRELFGGKLPTGLPLWARTKMDRRLYAILTDNRPMKYRDDDEEDESCTEISQPASDASGPGGPIKTEEAAKVRKKPAAKRTGKVSKRTAKRKTSTTDSSVSGTKRSNEEPESA